MTPERALEITAACASTVTARMFGRESPKLPDVSLAELLEANAAVEKMKPTDNGDGTKTLHCHCDPRIVAAYYALENYGNDPRQLLKAVGYEITSEADE